MKSFISQRTLVFLIAGLATPGVMQAQLIFEDDFETGDMTANWTATGADSLRPDNTRNIIPAGGSWSAKLTNSIQRSFHNEELQQIV